MSQPQVVKIFVTAQEPDYDSPWQTSAPWTATGSGVVIGEGQVLTGAHVVADATFIQVQKLSDPNKCVARVEAVCHDCDLALLAVDEPSFTADIEPARVGQLPALQDSVSVVGFPVGGEEISITEGVVSRVEVQKYDHSQRRLLAATVDAAINEGNSGGPVFRRGEVIGIAFQKLEDADNIGEIVPAPVIRHFLNGIAQGRAQVVPGLGLTSQNLENPFLRQQLGMTPEQSGVLVCTVEHGGSSWGVVEPGDALLELGGYPVANNGTIHYMGRFRTSFAAVLCDYYVGDTLEMKILREGEVRDVQIEMQPLRDLVPRSLYDTRPAYFVYGGIVFQTLTLDLLKTWREWWNRAPPEFLNHYYSGVRTAERQEVVVISQILADEINVGYAEFFNECVTCVNGQMPRSLADFVERVERAEGVVEIKTSRAGTIMFDAAEVRRAMPRIMKRYRVPRDRSSRL